MAKSVIITGSEWSNLLSLPKDELKQKLIDLIKDGLWLRDKRGVDICKTLPPHDAYEVMCEYAVRWLRIDNKIQDEFVVFSTEDLFDLVTKMMEEAREDQRGVFFGNPFSPKLQWHMFEKWPAEQSLPILSELYTLGALDYKLKFVVRKAIRLVEVKNFLASIPRPVNEATLQEYVENATT